MKFKGVLFLLLAAGIMLVQACETCTDTDSIEIGPGKQSFSVTYLTPGGTNYIDSIYNQFNVRVFLNTKGGLGQYQLVSEDLSDGMFGPYEFTQNPVAAQIGVPYKYVYVFEKDTFGNDTLMVQFVANTDQCRTFWQQLDYVWSPNLLYNAPPGANTPEPESGQEIVNLTIVE